MEPVKKIHGLQVHVSPKSTVNFSSMNKLLLFFMDVHSFFSQLSSMDREASRPKTPTSSFNLQFCG